MIKQKTDSTFIFRYSSNKIYLILTKVALYWGLQGLVLLDMCATSQHCACRKRAGLPSQYCHTIFVNLTSPFFPYWWLLCNQIFQRHNIKEKHTSCCYFHNTSQLLKANENTAYKNMGVVPWEIVYNVLYRQTEILLVR